MYSLDKEQCLSNELYWQILEEAFPIFFNQENWQQDVDNLARLARLTPISKILDIECGVGKYSISFAKRGYSVFGCDSRDCYLTIAKENAMANRVDIHWSNQGLRSIHFPSCSFDLVTLLSCTFSYLKTPEEDLFFLKKVYDSLSHNGMFIMEIIGREALEAHFQQKGWVSLSSGAFLLWERKIIRELGWLNESLTLVQDSVKKSCSGGVRIFYTPHILKMLEQAGFVNVKLYQDLQGSPYSENSPQLIITAEKCGGKTMLMRG